MRSVEQEYRKLNEQIMPSDALIAKTRELMQEELSADRVQARNKKRMMKRIASYAAVAAATAVICIGVMSALPRAESEAPQSAAPMESMMEETVMMDEAAAEENVVFDSAAAAPEANMEQESMREIADVTVYYVEDGEIVSTVIEDMDCSIENLFDAWAKQNGISGVAITMVDVQDTGASVGAHIDFSENLSTWLDTDGLMAASLSMTLGEYLNADGIILTCDGQPI
jgi:hypothetical protein